MIIHCTIPVSPENLWDYAQKIRGFPPLPGYITKRSACVNKRGAIHQILILYEVDKSNFPEAMKYICNDLSSLRDVCEISIPAYSYGPHSSFLIFEKATEV